MSHCPFVFYLLFDVAPTAVIAIYLLPQLIYGYGSLEDTLFRSTISKEGEIFFVEDKEIGLRDLAMNVAIPTDPGKRTVKGNLCYAPVIRNPHSGLSGHSLFMQVKVSEVLCSQEQK